MGKKSKCPYAGIESELSNLNRNYIRYNGQENHKKRIEIERIVKKITSEMKRKSPVFGKLFKRIFGGGSSYEGLKIGDGGDFDMDILLEMPEETCTIIEEGNVPGFVQLRLQNFDCLRKTQPDLHRAMREFVDEDNYLLTDKLQSKFMQSIFDSARNEFFPRIITLGDRRYEVLRKFEIERVRRSGPAFTLTINGGIFSSSVDIDLVPCIWLPKKMWPRGGFRPNPYMSPKHEGFFIVPKLPKREHPHLFRYFRLSFQIQERVIISNRFWMKPTIRIMKLIRDNFEHGVSSYAIKAIFMLELVKQNPELDKNTPDLWKGCFSNCFVYMLRKYLEYLDSDDRKIPYFWNSKLNLLDNLSVEQINKCRKDIRNLVFAIEQNPSGETVRRYLEPKTE